MRALLDVNVLLALFDEDHVHHELARDWLVEHAGDGWASTPITENGFIRVISQPAYPDGISVAAAMELLTSARVSPTHEFWPADISALDVLSARQVHGPKQLTDLYLLALAVHHDGCFVTFDDRVPAGAVHSVEDGRLVVLRRAR